MPSTMSKEAYQRLVLLHLIRQFPRGVMGSFRLQKVLYFATGSGMAAVYLSSHHEYGQYSTEVAARWPKKELVRQGELRGRYDGGSHWLASDIFESEPIENALSTFP